MTSALQLNSPAKLNLFLHINKYREDGYHDIQTVFQLIELHDEMTFTLRDDDKTTLTTAPINFADQDNLIYKAINALKPYAKNKPGVDIYLQKNIPMGGGLGGGSSNAATTLLAMNKLWNLKLPKEKLLEIGRPLGADVSVFINGENAWAEGIGDQLTPINLPEAWYVVIAPEIHASTPKMYAHPDLCRNTPTITPQDYLDGAATHNDFLPVLLLQHPQLAETFAWLRSLGDIKLSGSGACMFIACNNKEQAQDLIGQISPRLVAFVARGLQVSNCSEILAKG